MILLSITDEIINYIKEINLLEFGGLLFGLLCVYFLIKENVLTWICGIIYVLISFVVFWQSRLYGDFLLHIIFLILNIYGWYSWTGGSKDAKDKASTELNVSTLTRKASIIQLAFSAIGILIFAQVLIYIPSMIEGVDAAALPYWDSTTSILSVTAMWLTTKKKIENWYYWLAIDILATGIYFYKELYFYSLLYFIYIFLAIAGYIAWKKSMNKSLAI